MAIIICDIDGTLITGGKAVRKTVDFINSKYGESTIILVTGRPNTQRQSTVASLRRLGIKYNQLKMAPPNTTHQDRIAFKRETARKLKATATVTLAIDNDPDARSAYSSLGISTKNPSSLPAIKKIWDSSAFKFF